MKVKGAIMSVIHSSIFLVIKKFPEHRGMIQRLSKSNGEFQTLCEDYRMCKEALGYWNISDSDQSLLRIKEYRSLLKELENEILLNVTVFTK